MNEIQCINLHKLCLECFCVECSLCRERVVACCYKSTTAADRLFAFVELTSLVFNLHGVTSLVFNLYGLTSHVLPLCTQFSKLNIAGLRCFSDLSTQWKCGEVSSQIHGEVSQEYQNIDIARFPLAPFMCFTLKHIFSTFFLKMS